MAAEVHHTAEQLAIGSPGTNHDDIGVDRAGGFGDFRVVLAGVGHGHAAAHAEAAVEGHHFFAPTPYRTGGGGQAAMRLANRLDNACFHLFEVFQVGHAGVVVGQFADQGVTVVVVAGHHHTHRPRGVAVRCADQHRAAGDATAFLDPVTHAGHAAAVDPEGVEPHKSDHGFSIIKHRGPSLAGIVETLVEDLAVPARLLHAQLRCDVAFGETCPEDHRGLGRHPAFQ